MDERGHIRELSDGETPGLSEIDVSRDAGKLHAMSIRARKDYYRAIRQGLSEDAALSCAQASERSVLASGPSKAPYIPWHRHPRRVGGN